MPTLLLRIAAPQQSWGDNSRFNQRETRREPTKSGILGMIAAAEGRKRDSDLSDLAQLRFGVRIDQPGNLETDFQTETDWRTGKSKALTHRTYLSDAKFLVGVWCNDRSRLESFCKALMNPHFPLFLGRRAFPPTGRLVLGIKDETLVEALEQYPWLASEHERLKHPQHVHLEIIRDAAEGDPVDEIIQDVPVCFNLKDRRYNARAVMRHSVKIENPKADTKSVPPMPALPNAHDPFSFLEGA